MSKRVKGYEKSHQRVSAVRSGFLIHDLKSKQNGGRLLTQGKIPPEELAQAMFARANPAGPLKRVSPTGRRERSQDEIRESNYVGGFERGLENSGANGNQTDCKAGKKNLPTK